MYSYFFMNMLNFLHKCVNIFNNHFLLFYFYSVKSSFFKKTSIILKITTYYSKCLIFKIQLMHYGYTHIMCYNVIHFVYEY